jgi:hypothetical protein
VNLSGIHTREGVEATWRDLKARFPKLVPDHALLALDPIPTLQVEAEAATWYRLAIESFADKQQATDYCLELRRAQTRCDIEEYVFDNEELIVGRFPWPDRRLEDPNVVDHQGLDQNIK